MIFKNINEFITFFIKNKESDLEKNNKECVINIPEKYISTEIKQIYNSIQGGFINIAEDEVWRFLNIKELEELEDNYEYNFIENNLLPFIDCYDSNYICYDFKNKKYVLYNITDKIVFEEYKTLLEIINEQQNDNNN